MPYDRNRLISFKKINCPDSFVGFTKAKGTTGNGEAKLWLKEFPANDKGKHLANNFFQNFRETNKYYFLKENLISYLENASYEYFNQEIKINEKIGYRNDIASRYQNFKNKISSIDRDWSITKKDFELVEQKQGWYIRPTDLSRDSKKSIIADHPWNFMRNMILPKITKINIEKIMYVSRYEFYFLLEIDLDYKKYIYHNSPELINQTIKEINEKFLGSEKKRLLDARLGQGYFRKQILSRVDYCLITNMNKVNFLEASHIKPWTKSNPIEKVDLYNGILLTPNCHKLFDLGFISFNNNGELLKSKKLNSSDYNKLFTEDKNVDRKILQNEKTKVYLDWHRRNIFGKFEHINF